MNIADVKRNAFAMPRFAPIERNVLAVFSNPNESITKVCTEFLVQKVQRDEGATAAHGPLPQVTAPAQKMASAIGINRWEPQIL